MYMALVESVSTYGMEVLTVSKKNRKKLKAMEVNYWRRSCGLTG
jgi:hypothetical protein